MEEILGIRALGARFCCRGGSQGGDARVLVVGQSRGGRGVHGHGQDGWRRRRERRRFGGRVDLCRLSGGGRGVLEKAAAVVVHGAGRKANVRVVHLEHW